VTLDDALAELYGVGLDDFAAERTRLARELRAAGQKDDAAAVAKVRKPTLAAWVLNQLARRNSREVDLLLHAGHRLRQSQAGVVRGGGREAYEQARQAEAEALRHLGREAAVLLRSARGGATDATLAQVVNGLRAAAVSDEGRERLARGTFVRPPEEASGFGLLGELVGELPDAPKRKARPADARREQARRTKAELREARARLRDAEGSLKAAEKAKREAERAAGAAAAQVEAARAEVERLEKALEQGSG
jgi:hypothetical protein